MTSKTEIWKSLPGVPGVEVSTFGNVHTLDRVVSSEEYTRFTQGHVLKQHDNGIGYLLVSIPIDGKWTTKYLHRLVAETFLSNPDNLPQVNHKDNNRMNNNVSNLEWCTASYNGKYREKFGDASGKPVVAVNLSTLEVYQFPSQIEASRKLGFSVSNVNNVITGKQNQTHGYWFTNDDNNADDIIKRKLKDIKGEA